MAAREQGTRNRSRARIELDVCLGRNAIPVGKLVYTKDGQREFSQFAYREDWINHPDVFDISPDLDRVLGYQVHRAPSRDDSCFFHALADTEPDSWGRRVIARAHAKERGKNPALDALTALDYLCAVDDFSRIGALRLRDGTQTYLKTAEAGRRTTPPLLELEKIMSASRAVELGTETAEDLKYLRGKGTSLGGARPKCSLIDGNGALALGKFPSIKDERSVTRGEVLSLRLADLAGINAAHARIVMVQNDPVAVIRRFDRTMDDGRIPYISGATLLQASRNDEHAYTEIVDVMRSRCINFTASARQLWRRLVFNFLITNVDDHLQNIGFLYAGNNQWELSPAFDLNPFPDKDRESKTWLSEDTGPITSVEQLLGQADRFQLDRDEARAVLEEVTKVLKQWRQVALSSETGMSKSELEDFAPAFEHESLGEAISIAGRKPIQI